MPVPPLQAAAPAVRTVLGDIAPAQLGVCDAHDHLFLRSAALPAGQELSDASAAEAELRAFAALGGRSVIQWTPYGMGRRSGAVVELARATGLQLVLATGVHQLQHYAGSAALPPDLTALFVEELTRGVRGSGCGQAPRAGLIKVAGGFHGLDAHARRSMTAAAEAHRATGAPIAVHLEGGTAAEDVLELLCRSLGVPPRHVLLGHLGRFPDLRMQRAVARSGAWLVFDGPSQAHRATDWRLMDSLTELAGDGHGDRLLLGADTTTAGARGAPGLAHLLRVLRPRLVRELGEQLADAVFVTNPARAFAAEWTG